MLARKAGALQDELAKVSRKEARQVRLRVV